MTAGWLRPIGFLALMLGFGLRLDTSWDGTATVLLGVGTVAAAVGLLARRPPQPDEADAPGPGGEPRTPTSAFTPPGDAR